MGTVEWTAVPLLLPVSFDIVSIADNVLVCCLSFKLLVI